MGCGGGSRRSQEYEEPRERSSGRAANQNDEALRVLGVRLAKGEITKREYEDLKATLEKDAVVENRQVEHAHEPTEEGHGHERRRRGWLDSIGRGGC